MAAHANSDLSTIAPDGAMNPVQVKEQANGMVHVKWGDGGAKQTSATAGTDYPSFFSVADANGEDPLVKTYGTLLGCNDGTLTIGDTSYRIQAIRLKQSPATAPLPRVQLWASSTACARRPRVPESPKLGSIHCCSGGMPRGRFISNSENLHGTFDASRRKRRAGNWLLRRNSCIIWNRENSACCHGKHGCTSAVASNSPLRKHVARDPTVLPATRSPRTTTVFGPQVVEGFSWDDF